LFIKVIKNQEMNDIQYFKITEVELILK